MYDVPAIVEYVLKETGIKVSFSSSLVPRSTTSLILDPCRRNIAHLDRTLARSEYQ